MKRCSDSLFPKLTSFGFLLVVLLSQGLVFSASAAGVVGHQAGKNMPWKVEKIIHPTFGVAQNYGEPAKVGEDVWLLKRYKDAKGVVRDKLHKERVRHPMRGRRLQILYVGSSMSYRELEYMDSLGEKLIQWFQNQFGWEVSPKFFFNVVLFSSKEQWEKTKFKGGLGVTLQNIEKVDDALLYFYVDKKDKTGQAWREFEMTLVHEMSHSITWQLYGPWPKPVEEGLAEYLSFLLCYGGQEIYRSKDPIVKMGYSICLAGKGNRYLDTLMNCYSYDHWDYAWRNEYELIQKNGISGRSMVGYNMPTYLVDFLVSNPRRARAFKLAINNAHKFKGQHDRGDQEDIVVMPVAGEGKKPFAVSKWDIARTDAFRAQLYKSYPGGLEALNVDWQRWLVKKLSRPPPLTGGGLGGFPSAPTLPGGGSTTPGLPGTSGGEGLPAAPGAPGAGGLPPGAPGGGGTDPFSPPSGGPGGLPPSPRQ